MIHKRNGRVQRRPYGGSYFFEKHGPATERETVGRHDRFAEKNGTLNRIGSILPERQRQIVRFPEPTPERLLQRLHPVGRTVDSDAFAVYRGSQSLRIERPYFRNGDSRRVGKRRQLESNGIAAVRQAFAETVCKGVVTGQAVGKTERSYECDPARGKHACGPQDDQSQRKAGRYHAETAYGAAVPLGLVKVSHDCSVFV